VTKAIQKITLSSSRDIPFDKLVLSQSNVRHVKAGVSIEELAEDIARRGLLMGLSVRAVVDEAGGETGMFEIPAGGRRYRALAVLVKQKRLARNAPVPCVVRTEGLAEEDSLAENVQRAPLHPLDQFRAFLTLREKGQSEEEIAANQFVSVAVVRQRLRLASVAPKLLDVYAEDGMTLDQLMAFTVNGDHQRQEQVFERLAQSYDKQPYVIRRMLTEGAVRASDKRAQFIGVADYEDAGGVVLNDLFQGDDGGWLQDVGLVDMMVAEKLNEQAAAIRAEGWKWVEVAPDFAYGHTYGLRQLRGETVPLTDEEEATLAVSMPIEFSPKAPVENSPLRCGLVATISPRRIDVGEVGQVELDDGLQSLGGGGLSQSFGQGFGPGGVFGLQGEEFGDGVVPALGTGPPVGGPAIADDGAGLVGLTGPIAGLAFGIAERVSAFRLWVFRHGWSPLRNAWQAEPLDRLAQTAAIVSATALGGLPRRLGWASGRTLGGWTGGSRSACWRMR